MAPRMAKVGSASATTGAYAGLTGKLTAAGISAHDAKLTFSLR